MLRQLMNDPQLGERARVLLEPIAQPWIDVIEDIRKAKAQMHQPAEQQLVIGRTGKIHEIDATLTADAGDAPSVMPQDACAQIADPPSAGTARQESARPDHLNIRRNERAQLGLERFLIELRPNGQDRRPPTVLRKVRRKLPGTMRRRE